jgi:predicted ATPase
MAAHFLRRLRLDNFLTFAPGSGACDLLSLNVLIGPNGSGKSNVIEAIELLRATSTDFADAIRDGGGAEEWLWKGNRSLAPATVEAELSLCPYTNRPLRYRLEFSAVQSRVEVLDEAIEEVQPIPGKADVKFYYRFQRGRPMIHARGLGPDETSGPRGLQRAALLPDQSVLAQRKDPERYPEVTWLGGQFGSIQTFREWTFGRYATLRRPQSAALPDDHLLPDASNLALVLNQIEHKDGQRFNHLLKRFFPRFERMSTRVSGGSVQFYLHETGFSAPIPPTRLSDGTIRFVAMLAILLADPLPALICIEEPELGLHPDSMTIIAELLMDTAARTQLIVTTHSDALVSALTVQPDCVVVCERPGAGTILRRLDPQQLSTWLNEYRLGDLWRMGELGANP